MAAGYSLSWLNPVVGRTLNLRLEGGRVGAGPARRVVEARETVPHRVRVTLHERGLVGRRGLDRGLWRQRRLGSTCQACPGALDLGTLGGKRAELREGSRGDVGLLVVLLDHRGGL